MFKLLRLFFTIGGIGLLLGAIVTNDWTSLSERFCCGFAGFVMFTICQPSVSFRLLRWLWNALVSGIKMLLNIPLKKTPTAPNPIESDSRQHIDIEDSPHYECTPPTPITRDNISILSGEEMVTIMRNYRIESDSRQHVDIEDSPHYDSTPPTPITRGNISILSGEEMVTIMRNYRVVDEIRTKVKGVTFRNNDGTDRQTILAHCHTGDQLRFEPFEYEGSPAYAVHCEWGQIGNLSADLAEELAELIAARSNNCLILGEILNISGGYQGEYFGCNISLTVYEKRY